MVKSGIVQPILSFVFMVLNPGKRSGYSRREDQTTEFAITNWIMSGRGIENPDGKLPDALHTGRLTGLKLKRLPKEGSGLWTVTERIALGAQASLPASSGNVRQAGSGQLSVSKALSCLHKPVPP
jgi:hypothetical protein